MSEWVWSGWITWRLASDQGVPADIRPGGLVEADLIARPHRMEWCRKARRSTFVVAHRFTVVTGVAWMAAPLPSLRTTHFRAAVPDPSGRHFPYLRAEEVSA